MVCPLPWTETLGGLLVEVDEGTRVAILFQDLSQVALLLLQVVLCAGDTPSPVKQTPDHPPLDMRWVMRWVMGPEVKVAKQNGYPGAFIRSSRHPPRQVPQESPSKEGDLELCYKLNIYDGIEGVGRSQ